MRIGFRSTGRFVVKGAPHESSHALSFMRAVSHPMLVTVPIDTCAAIAYINRTVAVSCTDTNGMCI